MERDIQKETGLRAWGGALRADDYWTISFVRHRGQGVSSGVLPGSPGHQASCPCLRNGDGGRSRLSVRLPADAHVWPPCDTPPLLSPATEAAPGCVGDMADTPRDTGLKQAPGPRTEKAAVDFGYVGIDSILEQMRRKAMKQGFEFNIMVVGEPHCPCQGCRGPSGPGLGLLVCGVGATGWSRLVLCVHQALPGGPQLRPALPLPAEPPAAWAGVR